MGGIGTVSAPAERRSLIRRFLIALGGFSVVALIVAVAGVWGWRVGFDHRRFFPGDDIFNPLITLGYCLAGAFVFVVAALFLISAPAVTVVLLRRGAPLAHSSPPLLPPPSSRE